ncbi:MAG: hypothetical protein ACRBK7_01930 [Acidimicrobiales bacterium]
MTADMPDDRVLKVELIPEFAEVAIRGQIVELAQAEYLVADPTREAFGGSTALIARELSVPIATPVVIRVHEVLGARPDWVELVTAGTELSVWASGGQVNFTITPAEAERTGLRPDISHEEEQAIIDSGAEPPSGPGPVPEKAFELGYDSPEFVSMAEGQEVIAFLRWADWYDPIANDGSSHKDLRLVVFLDINGAGLFVRDPNPQDTPNGSFTHAATTVRIAEQDLISAATAIDSLRGRAPTPGWFAKKLYHSP